MEFNEMLTTGRNLTEDKIIGVVIGVVADIKDPLNQGRIRVNFPWRAAETGYSGGEDSTENDQVDSTWARMATLMGGPDRGSYFIPEVGDEVLVAFHHGDPERPYIIGGLWNQTQSPPESMDDQGKNNLRTFKSRSGHILTFNDNREESKEKIILKSNSGHEVILDDESGKEKISMKTSQNHKVILDDASNKILVEDKSGNKIELETNSNSVTIDVKGNAEIKALRDASVSATGSVSVSGKMGVTIDDPANIKLGQAAFLGLVNETMLAIFNAHTHPLIIPSGITGPPVPLAIPKSQTTIITKGA